MKIAPRILAAALLLSGLSAYGQQAKQTLSFDEALAAALQNNPALEAAVYEEKAAMQERRAAIGLRMPQINLSGAYAYLGKDIGLDLNDKKGALKGAAETILGSGVVPPEMIPTISGLINPLFSADWKLTLQDRSLGFIGGEVTLPLYLGGKINTANRAARINEQTAVEQSNQTRNALVSELVERYFGLTLARQVVEVRQQVVDGVRRHLEDAEALEKSGMIAHSELLYVQFKMTEAERELQNARLQAETVASALNNTLGEETACQPVTSMFILDELEGVAYYQDLARKYSPLLNQVSLKRKLAEEGVKLQRSAFLPQVAAMGGAMFYGLNREYKYSAARHTARRVGALEQKAGQDIAVLVEKLYNQMENYRNQMASIDASLDFASEYLKVQNAAFLAGMASSSELIDAELNLAKVRTERLQAAYNYDLMLARLLEAAGVSDEFASYIRRPDARQVLFVREK